VTLQLLKDYTDPGGTTHRAGSVLKLPSFAATRLIATGVAREIRREPAETKDESGDEPDDEAEAEAEEEAV